MMETTKMPKNVRQIGRAVAGNEIYIEDYVITFARKQARKQAEPQLAVLLGKERTAVGEPLFINGAVLVENFHIENTLLLNNENWSQVYEEIKNHFSELEIAGCLLIRSIPGEEINDRVRRLHKENFDGAGKVLFLYDGEEREESLYLSDGMMLKKQEGFYIYYEKNEAMQEYMIGKSDGASEEPLFDDKAMKRVRETIAAKPAARGQSRGPEQKMLQLMYGASTVLAAAVLVIGMTMLESNDKMQSMETTLNTISDKVSEASKEPVIVETLTGNTGKSSNEEMKEELEKKDKEDSEQEESSEKEENGETEDKEEKPEEPEESEEAKEVEKEEPSKETEKKVTYYTVKEGDTLASISMKRYKTLEVIDEIQKLNAIDDKDKIYAGEKILLP